MDKKQIKLKFDEFKKEPYPQDETSLIDESTKADLMLIETQLAGLILTYCDHDFSAEEKKLFLGLKEDLRNFIESFPKNKNNGIMQRYKELYEIVEAIS